MLVVEVLSGIIFFWLSNGVYFLSYFIGSQTMLRKRVHSIGTLCVFQFHKYMWVALVVLAEGTYIN